MFSVLLPASLQAHSRADVSQNIYTCFFPTLMCVCVCVCVCVCFRFREGLRTMGVYEQIQMTPEAFYQLFCFPQEKLCADSMVTMFSPQFSEREDYRAREGLTAKHWQQFLTECEGGYPFWRTQ